MNRRANRQEIAEAAHLAHVEAAQHQLAAGDGEGAIAEMASQ